VSKSSRPAGPGTKPQPLIPSDNFTKGHDISRAFILWLSGIALAVAALGNIALTVQPSTGPIACGDTVDLMFRISGKTDTTEIDGYSFRITYDPALFSFVSGSGAINDIAGSDENWLRFPAQESVGAGAVPLSDFTISSSGVIDVAVVDLRVPPDLNNPRGSAASAGFLYALSLQAIAPGTGTVSVVSGAGGAVLFNASMNPSGLPSLNSATLSVVGPRLSIARSGNQAVVSWPKTGTLETAINVTGPWTNIVGAASPFSTNIVSPRRFFPLRIP
jgi:hypothetical protein